MNKHFGKILEKEKAEREAADRIKAAEIERRRQETERLKAEGNTTANTNTSKKKIQARQKAELDGIKAAAVREEKAARRARLGIEEEQLPDSQVGTRRYARGRAYVADRFTNPQGAAEATEKAAAESESFEATQKEEGSLPDTTEVVKAEEVITEEAKSGENVDTASEEEDEALFAGEAEENDEN